MIGIDAQGGATVMAAHHQHVEHNYYGPELVEVRPIPADDFRACDSTQFVPPRGGWDTAITNFERDNALIIAGDEGSGRRTAALRLLRLRCPTESVFELEPAWEQPRISLLPTVQRGAGYLLDLSQPTVKPFRPDLGKQLLDWARDRSACLIVLTTAQTSVQRWTTGVAGSIVALGSPDATDLARNRLIVLGAADKLQLIDEEGQLAEILAKQPKAADSCRLAQIIADDLTNDVDLIIGEYTNWSHDIEAQLDKLSGQLGLRALLWASAFCDGGEPGSILRMAEALHQKVAKDSRSDLDILSEPPASIRLKNAGVTVSEGKAFPGAAKHGYAAAVRHHLWEQYKPQVDCLPDWVIEQMDNLPTADTDRVIEAVIDLALRHRDNELLTSLRDKLNSDARRTRAAQVFSAAAVDPRSGRYVRERLYAWLHKPSAEVTALVLETCGGRLGEVLPDRALTRIQRAAPHCTPGDPILVQTMVNLVQHHPVRVLRALDTWAAASQSASSQPAAVTIFLALAMRAEGAQLLCADVEGEIARRRLVRMFRAALASGVHREAAVAVLHAWMTYAEDRVLDTDYVSEVFADVFAPSVADNGMRELLPAARLDTTTFWGRIFFDAAGKSKTSDSDDICAP